MPQIPLKNSGKALVTTETIYNDIINYIKEIPNYTTLRNDIELIEFICQNIENEIKSYNKTSKNPIDKLQLAIRIMTDLFNLNQAEKEVVEKQIQYLFQNGIIRKKPILLAIKSLKSFILKKFI